MIRAIAIKPCWPARGHQTEGPCQAAQSLRGISASARGQLIRLPLRSSPKLFAQKSKSRPGFLQFESDLPTDGEQRQLKGTDAGDKGDEIVSRATAALEKARALLEEQQQKTPARPATLEFQPWAEDTSDAPSSGNQQDDFSVKHSLSSIDAQEHGAGMPTPARSSHGSTPDWVGKGPPNLNDSFDEQQTAVPSVDLSESSTASTSSAAPASTHWEDFLPQQQRAESAAPQRELDFAEPATATFEFISQDAQDAIRARTATLPPLQSVLDLTSASQMPQRGELTEDALPSAAGRIMEDGAGVLADGTRYERKSGEERGPDGYWYRWTRLRGISQGGKVEWEERWWEASDWAGMKEMGAEKCGCSADGSAWRETWREAIAFDQESGEPLVERSAHKWAHDAKGDEWEEKWGEHYRAKGHTNKYADKWARDGSDVWHERWGEDYDGHGGCKKWTDKWAERTLEDGQLEQWGDKWDETFKDGSGNKTGETWSIDGGGNRYQRWWGENHFGNGWVQKYGNSSTGEHWDASEQMDTYYNPIPHFDYRLALLHSPTLRSVPLHPRGGDELGDGLDIL
ncbi:hypothetical protein WJX73_000201 [Symbiochloris irregularis]|uniref:Uncharacterized protein n=1 Tax=Symbiochloris irregularis TaxID=706552 RepID=A0AAW1NZ72_9CHLO